MDKKANSFDNDEDKKRRGGNVIHKKKKKRIKREEYRKYRMAAMTKMVDDVSQQVSD